MILILRDTKVANNCQEKDSNDGLFKKTNKTENL